MLLGISQAAWAQTAIQGVTTHQSRCPNTGTITITATGSNLRYSISGKEAGTGNTVTLGPQDNNTFTTVNPGTYTVTVRDYTNVNETPATRDSVTVGGSYASLLFSAAVTDQSCKAGNDGSITVSVNAGTGRAAYTYSLLDQNNNVLQSQASNTFAGLAPATYRVQVSDSCTNVSRQDVTVGSKVYGSTIGGQLATEGFTSCSVVSLVFVPTSGPSTWQAPFTVTQVGGGGQLVSDPTVLNSLSGSDAKIPFDITGADFFVSSATSNTPRLRITDACGRVYEQDVYSTQTASVDRIANSDCNGIDITARLPYVRLYDNGQVQLTVLDANGGTVAGPSAPTRTTTGASGEYDWKLSNLAPGNYTLHFANGCQSLDYPITQGVVALGTPKVSCGISCTAGRTDVLFSPGTPDGDTAPAAPYTYTLTSGPAGQNYPLTYSSNGGYYTIPGLLPGSYTYTLTTKCGDSTGGSFDANCADYTFGQKAEAQPTCGNLRLGAAYSPDAGVPYAYVVRTLQQQDSNGNYQNVTAGSTDDLGQTSLGTYTLRYNSLNPGTYREQISYGPYEQPCRVAYSPVVTLAPSAPTLDVSQAFNCDDKTSGQITGVASGGYPPYTYYLLDTGNNDAVLSSNTTGNFTNLATSTRYAIRAEDACNSARRDVALRPLSPPDVPVTRLSCDDTSLTLQARDLYGATYSWTGPNNFSSTDRTITLTNIDASKTGTYTVTATLNGCSSTSSQYVVKDDYCDAPLPVTLVRFTAQRQPSGAVALAWTTASELNSLRFDVERSLDGQQFASVGEVAAAGNSATTRAYAFTDGAAMAGRLYYRLRQLDRDGTAHYSTVAMVAGGSAFAAYPNPWVGPALQLQLGAAPTGPLTCTLHNAAGQLVLRTTLPAGSTVLQAPGLAPGFYHLAVESNGTLLGSQRLMRE